MLFFFFTMGDLCYANILVLARENLVSAVCNVFLVLALLAKRNYVSLAFV